MLNFLLLLQFLLTPIQPPDVTKVIDLIEHRSYLLGHPLDEPNAKILANIVLEESKTLNVSMILAVIEIESRYEKRGKSKKNCRGFMQLSKGTAQTIGKKYGISYIDLYDIKTNVTLGVRYLADLLEENGSIEKALTIYNRGFKSFSSHGKRISGYAMSVVRRSKLLDKMLKNGLTCKNNLTS